MLNGVHISYIIMMLITGATLLAFIYHSILFFHRKTKLLGHYSLYLGCIFLYCLYRLFYPQKPPGSAAWLNPDESLQMVSYLLYVNFIGTALRLDKAKDKASYLFVKATPLLIIIYIIIQLILWRPENQLPAVRLGEVSIRSYLLILGFFMLLLVLRKRKLLFYNYLSAGAISMIVFGILSSYAFISPQGKFIIEASSWLFIGLFFDIIFFSAAIGYNIKVEALEREKALETIVLQQETLRQKDFEKQEAIYQAQLQERLRMGKDLHDDIGATLSSIAMYSETVKNQVKEKLPHLEPVLNKMGENSREMVTSMSDIIWAINPDNDEGEKLVNRMEAYSRDICSIKNIHLRFKTDELFSKTVLPPEHRKNIYLIFKEALNNSLKYSQASEIEISITCPDNILQLCVNDNGSGFDTVADPKGNGLKNMRKRCAEINAELKISSGAETGTCIWLYYPLRQETSPLLGIDGSAIKNNI